MISRLLSQQPRILRRRWQAQKFSQGKERGTVFEKFERVPQKIFFLNSVTLSYLEAFHTNSILYEKKSLRPESF